MATGKIITQTDQGRVEKRGGHGLYVVRIYDGNYQKSYKKKQEALAAFRQLDQRAQHRNTLRLQRQRLQQEGLYGSW